MDLQEFRWGGIHWINLVEDRDRWWAVVNAVMNVLFHKMRGISWLNQNLSSFEEGILD